MALGTIQLTEKSACPSSQALGGYVNREGGSEREREGESDRDRERECVCVSEREREKRRWGGRKKRGI